MRIKKEETLRPSADIEHFSITTCRLIFAELVWVLRTFSDLCAAETARSPMLQSKDKTQTFMSSKMSCCMRLKPSGTISEKFTFCFYSLGQILVAGQKHEPNVWWLSEKCSSLNNMSGNPGAAGATEISVEGFYILIYCALHQIIVKWGEQRRMA